MSSTKKPPLADADRRKAQARSRRTGEADTRPDGLAAAEGGQEGDKEKPEKA